MTASTAGPLRQTKAARIRQALLLHWRTHSDREIAKAVGVSKPIAGSGAER